MNLEGFPIALQTSFGDHAFVRENGGEDRILS